MWVGCVNVLAEYKGKASISRLLFALTIVEIL